MDEDVLIHVTTEARSNQSVLVKWVDREGKTRRTYIMGALIQDGMVSIEELELGIEHDLGWSGLLSNTRFSQSGDCIAGAFEQANITDWKSLQNAPRIVGHICGEDIYQIVATLNGLLMNKEQDYD